MTTSSQQEFGQQWLAQQDLTTKEWIDIIEESNNIIRSGKLLRNHSDNKDENNELGKKYGKNIGKDIDHNKT